MNKLEGGKKLLGRVKKGQEDTPLVSIITVVYNNAEMIRRTIESVLGQDYGNIEYIIIDGGSRDGTIDIIREHERDLDYFVSEKDGGIYNAMNKGLSNASGDIIGIINSDDWYEKGALGDIAAHYRESKECIQYGLCRSHDSKGAYQVATYLASRLPEYMIAHPTCFVPHYLYKKHGVFDERFKIAGDYDLMLRYYSRGERFRFNEIVIANGTLGGMCNNNPLLSKKEMIMARYKNGIISRKQYIRDNIKIRIAAPFREVENYLRNASVLRN